MNSTANAMFASVNKILLYSYVQTNDDKLKFDYARFIHEEYGAGRVFRDICCSSRAFCVQTRITSRTKRWTEVCEEWVTHGIFRRYSVRWVKNQQSLEELNSNNYNAVIGSEKSSSSFGAKLAIDRMD